MLFFTLLFVSFFIELRFDGLVGFPGNAKEKLHQEKHGFLFPKPLKKIRKIKKRLIP